MFLQTALPPSNRKLAGPEYSLYNTKRDERALAGGYTTLPPSRCEPSPPSRILLQTALPPSRIEPNPFSRILLHTCLLFFVCCLLFALLRLASLFLRPVFLRLSSLFLRLVFLPPVPLYPFATPLYPFAAPFSLPGHNQTNGNCLFPPPPGAFPFT